MTTGAAYWDRQAATFDEQPDHGLRDPDVREAWRRLLLFHGCGLNTGLLNLTIPGSGNTISLTLGALQLG
jgi:hypothetical protein